MLVVTDATVINRDAIAAVTMTCDIGKVKLKKPSECNDDVHVEFSIVPVIQLVNGTEISMQSRTHSETLVVSPKEYRKWYSYRDLRDTKKAVIEILEQKLPAYKEKVAESTAKYISQLGQVVLHEELEES